MFFLSFDWSLFFEIGLIILFVTALIVISTIFITRTLRQRYREVYKYHSKMEIELRKTANLLSKKVPDPELAKYESIAIKELSHEQKKELLALVDSLFTKIDKNDPETAYIVETYERLQEMRRVRDGKAIIFNHQITMFPLNFYSRIFRIKKWELFTHQE
ncbi:MAG: hypothetical protein GX904_03505 [Acholeplasmataceae bacterium]|nr:hypothetical protein [Acholeplasmataceae bacterium]